MHHHGIEFLEVINGTVTERGKIGNLVGSKQYDKNMVKRSLERYFRTNPTPRTVAIIIIEHKEVSAEEFNATLLIALEEGYKL